MKEKFKGRLRDKKPKSLIKETGNNEFDNFFLSLALIFDDIKGLILFQDLLNKTYEPISPTIDVHNGEFAGLNMQIMRILSGIINEFLELLRESDVILSEEFLSKLNGMKPHVKELWEDLIAVAQSKQTRENSTTYALMMIRGNITFHYKNAGKNLKQGFINRFYKKEKSKILKNGAAYFSLEDTIEATRFYYADAAAEEYMMLISNNWNTYTKDINELVRAIQHAIYFLMIDYLKDKT